MNSIVENKKSSFTIKVIVVCIAIVALIQVILPDFSKLKRFDTPINKTYALSFVQNPEALYMTSEYWEEQRKYDNAIRDMRLAIGILEMHTADASVIKRYHDRLTYLQKHNQEK
jgi:hypothetical protein